MKKINLAITGCLGRMGQQIIKSVKSDKNFRLVALTEEKKVNNKIIHLLNIDDMDYLSENSKLYKSFIKKEVIGEVIEFDRLDQSEACEFVSSITGDNSRQVVSFGTEAGLFQEVGISTVVCGPGSIEQAHKIDEFIILDELKKCLKLLEIGRAHV